MEKREREDGGREEEEGVEGKNTEEKERGGGKREGGGMGRVEQTAVKKKWKMDEGKKQTK